MNTSCSSSVSAISRSPSSISAHRSSASTSPISSKGSSPTLSSFSINKKGDGLPILRRKGFNYLNLAPLFKNKVAEPFVVTAKYDPAEHERPIKLSTHEGQEFDYILKGKLKVQIDDHVEVIGEGDSIYYNSGTPHGMIACEGGCEFIAVVINAQGKAYEYHAPSMEKKPSVYSDAKSGAVCGELHRHVSRRERRAEGNPFPQRGQVQLRV